MQYLEVLISHVLNVSLPSAVVVLSVTLWPLLFLSRSCILVLVAISILWIPLIQQMQGGQLFQYIQVKQIS